MLHVTNAVLRTFATLALCTALVACSQPSPTLDTSTEEAFQASLAAMMEEMPQDHQEELREALMAIAFANIDTSEGGLLGALAGMSNMASMGATAFASAHGLTAEEILAEAADIRRQRTLEQLASVESEIAELEAKRTAAEQAQAVLDLVVVEGPRFYWSESRFMSEPIIEFTLTNGTDRALARGFFNGEVATPGREIPWISEDFNTQFSGGLEPGESREIRLGPNQYSAWGNRDARDRDDTVFTMTVINAEDAAGERIAEEFSERDATRLETLLEQRIELQGGLARGGSG